MTIADNLHPFVSVIVPVYNGSKTLNLCLQALLELDYPKNRYEIIIVDNNSKDDSVEIIKRYPVSLYHETKIQTSYAARNKGIRESRGDIICFTDSDCIVDKQWLKELVNIFHDPKIGCIGGLILSYEPVTQVEKYIDKNMLVTHSKKTHFMAFAATANAAYRKSVFEKAGMFNVKYITGSDMEMSWRMQLKTDYEMAFTDKAIIYHKHRSNLKQFFLQRRRNGLASVILCDLYGSFPNYPKERYSNGFIKKRLIDETKSLIDNLPKILPTLSAKIKGEEPELSLLIFHTDRLGFIFGQLEGILKHRVLRMNPSIKTQ